MTPTGGELAIFASPENGSPGILGGTGDDATASGLRSEEADCTVHRRYQPFHEGHRALIIEGLKRVGQACIAVRNTQGIDDKNPFDFEYVRARIEHSLREFEGRFVVVPCPTLRPCFYGRDVGYTIERIDLDLSLESISATEVRKKILAN